VGTTILKSQQSQPIPVVVNRYAPLDSIQEELEASQHDKRTSEIALLRKKKEKKHPSHAKKRKIVIMGDSHARGYVDKISSSLG